MRKLLEELQKTDPTCYEEIARGLEQVDIEYEEDITQGCIQRAIEANSWIWTVTKEDSNSDEALAGTPYHAIIFTDDIDVLVDGIFAASPANAILTAYISAIRSQPCQS